MRSNGETANFSRALLDAARGDGDVFARAAAADPAAVAAGYARLAEPGAPAGRIIEKLPLNYLYLGAIARALPEAKILLVSRSPLDSCFAMYRTLFAAGYPFSYDLGDLGRYYAAYQQLMDHWRGALGGRLHEIVYEELVREPLRSGARIAQLLRTAVERRGDRHPEQQISVADGERRAGTAADLRQLLRALAALPPASAAADRHAARARDIHPGLSAARRSLEGITQADADLARGIDQVVIGQIVKLIRLGRRRQDLLLIEYIGHV